MPFVKGARVHGVTHVADVYNSPNVFANFVPIALWNDPQGTEAAIANAIASPTFAIDSSTIVFDGDENPTTVSIEQQRLIKEGVITQAELDAGKNAVPSTFDSTVAPVNTGTIEGSTTLSTKIDDTLLYQSPSTDTGITYYVKTVTKQPGVVFPYDVASIAPRNNVSVQEVCDNLRFLIINCFDLIKKQYPDAFITNSFRAKGTNSTSQHPRGMACDIQYSKASKAEYYTRALWIRDNIAFDQFILEYKTTGSKQPWHHISFNMAGNRSQIFTFLNDKNFKGPGVQGLYNLTNV
jgi:hypothetical protein